MLVHKNIKRPPLAETLERIRVIRDFDEWSWCELLGLNWSDYQKFKSGETRIELRPLENLSTQLSIPVQDLLHNRVDFVRLCIEAEPRHSQLPERYTRAAYGRRRSSIGSVEFLEKYFGWRLRTDVLKKFSVPESQFLDPFAPISIQFMSDLCEFLHRRSFRARDLFQMGAYSYESSRNTLLGQALSELGRVEEVYETFFSESLQIYEANCIYRLVRLNSHGGVVEAVANPDVATLLGTPNIGNQYVCDFKRGHIACLPLFIGRPMAQVRETACTHRGDNLCRFEFRFHLQPPLH